MISTETARAVRACWSWRCSPAARRRARASSAGASPARPAPRTSRKTAATRPTSTSPRSSASRRCPSPRLVIAVMIDEPAAGQYYGGAVAAPVFAQVMQGALRLLGVRARRAARRRSSCPARPMRRGKHVTSSRGQRPQALLAQLAAEGAMIERSAADSRRCGARRGLLRLSGRGRRRPRATSREAIARGAARVSVGERRLRLARRVARAERRRAEPASSSAGALAHAVLRPALRSAVDVRRHRHQRQDFLQPVDRRSARPRGSQDRRHRHARQRVSARARADRPTPRPTRSRLHRLLAEFAPPRRAGGGDGSVLARPRRRARVNGVAFDCALFTNLHARPPRLPRHACRPTREAKAQLFETPRPAGRGAQPRRRVRRAPRAAARGARRARHRLRLSAAPSDVPSSSSRRISATAARRRLESSLGQARSAAAARPLQRRQRARRARLPARATASPFEEALRAARDAAAGARAHAAGRRRRAAGGRRLRAHARCAGQGAARRCGRVAAARGGRLVVRVRLPAATATRQAAR